MGVLRYLAHEVDHFLHRGAALLRRGAHVLGPGEHLRGAFEDSPDRPGGTGDEPVHRVGHVPDFLDGRVRLHRGGEVAGLGHVPGPLCSRPEGPGEAPGEEDDHDGGHHEDGYDADVDRPAHGSFRGERFGRGRGSGDDVPVGEALEGHGFLFSLVGIGEPAVLPGHKLVGEGSERSPGHLPDGGTVKLQGRVVEEPEVPVHEEGVSRVVDLHRVERLVDEGEVEGNAHHGRRLAAHLHRHGVEHLVKAFLGFSEVTPVFSARVKGRPEPCRFGVFPIDELRRAGTYGVHVNIQGFFIGPPETHHEDVLRPEMLRVEDDEEASRMGRLYAQVVDELSVLGAELADHNLADVRVEHLGGEAGGDEGRQRLEHALETVEGRVKFMGEAVGQGFLEIIHHGVETAASGVHGIESYASHRKNQKRKHHEKNAGTKSVQFHNSIPFCTIVEKAFP